MKQVLYKQFQKIDNDESEIKNNNENNEDFNSDYYRNLSYELDSKIKLISGSSDVIS